MEGLIFFIKGLSTWIKMAFILKLTILSVMLIFNKIRIKEYIGFVLALPIGLLAISLVARMSSDGGGGVSCKKYNEYVVSCNNWVSMNGEMSSNFLSFSAWFSSHQYDANFMFSALVVLLIAYAEYGKNILSRNMDDTIRSFTLACFVMIVLTNSGLIISALNSFTEHAVSFFGINPSQITASAAKKINDYHIYLEKLKVIKANETLFENMRNDVSEGRTFYIKLINGVLYWMSFISLIVLTIQSVAMFFLSTFTLFSYLSGDFNEKTPLSILLTLTLLTPLSYGFLFLLNFIPELNDVSGVEAASVIGIFAVVGLIMATIKSLIIVMITYSLKTIFMGGKVYGR